MKKGRRFASVDAAPEADSVLRESFHRRGVPLQTPLYDLSDTASISPGEAWRQSSSALMEASRRYRGAEVLAGRVAQLSRWQLGGRLAVFGQWALEKPLQRCGQSSGLHRCGGRTGRRHFGGAVRRKADRRYR